MGIVAFGMIGGLSVAYLAFRNIRGGGAYRTLLIWPYAISPVVAGVAVLHDLRPDRRHLHARHGQRVWIDVPNYREHATLAQAAIILASG